MIKNLQQQQTEVGRVRLGILIPNADPKKRARPAKLDRFRFTSPRKSLIEAVAARYGGEVRPWQPPKGSQQWEVVTKTSEVPVLVPPQDPARSQWLELWSAGGCQRRCDGVTETITAKPCMCNPEKRDCSMHTRLRVMLEDIPGLGAWRVDTGSYYAAVELPGIASLLAMAQGAIPATLALEQRTVTRQVDGQPKTFNFAVPVLHVDELTPRQLMAGGVQQAIAAGRAALAANSGQQAISSTVDYASLAGAARTLDALTELRDRAVADERYDAALKALFMERAAAIKAGNQPAADEAVEGEVVDA